MFSFLSGLITLKKGIAMFEVFEGRIDFLKVFFVLGELEDFSLELGDKEVLFVGTDKLGGADILM